MASPSVDRRTFLTQASATTAIALVCPNINFGAKRKADEMVIRPNSHRYRVVPGWGILDAKENPVNDCHEMVEDAKGRLFLLTNETKNNILIYDKSGKLLDTWGTSYPGAHGDKTDKVISTPGGSAPVYNDGTLIAQRKDLSFSLFLHPHDVLVDSDENIYVPQWASQKTYPIKLQRVS